MLLVYISNISYDHATKKEEGERTKVNSQMLQKKIENLLSMLPKQIHLVTIIYKRIVPNVSSMFEKHWHVLQVNSKFKIFRESPIIA